jgi:L-aspartate oxidase
VYYLDIRPISSPIETDFLVIGAGVAGLRAAITLAEAGRVLVVAKASIQESSSDWAQGGIAVALSDDDEVALHEQDTLAAGDGLCDREAVQVLVTEGPEVIHELLDWGAAFDRGPNGLLFAREAAHSRNRVLHAFGDSTGREITRALWERVKQEPNVQVQPFEQVTDLLIQDGEVLGALAMDALEMTLTPIYARATLLAAGGLGRVFKDTTNPKVATGDGVAAAYRAGAEISDIEFVQFHPTALFVPGAPRFLLSEALRGEGAVLKNLNGERFMPNYHPMAELAPRDVVSRSIVAELARTGTTHALLDLTHKTPQFIQQRFPRIYETCLRYGVDISAGPAPVVPAAHYAMGGARTNLDGATSLRRLFAAGEAACTGVHGANRLASNSLLEGVVFGKRAARSMISGPFDPPPPMRSITRETAFEFPMIEEAELRRLAWTHAGILRSKDSLKQLLTTLDKVSWQHLPLPSRPHFELRSMFTVAHLMARCALAREESRGGHFRTDFPEKRPEFQRHSLVRRGHGVRFV